MTTLVGKTLKNRYRVIDSLGRGGMAEVYRVWDEYRSVDIAMKVLRQDIAQDPIFLRRFKREAQSLAKLQHPSIVRFYGMEREGLLAFLLMEYIEGQSLQSEILLSENHPLSNQRILEILKPICSALNYAHKMGLAHCDLKPGNILIEAGGRVLLTDFGIARTMDAATSTLVGAGTPAYMSPESIKGMDPTPQSDIYSLGIVLYEMLTGGERPFIGERATITGTTAEKVRWEHLHLNAVPVSKLNPGVDRRIDDVIAKCLAKDPRQRYSSALDVYIAMEALLAVGKVHGSGEKQTSQIIDESISRKHENEAFQNQAVNKPKLKKEKEYDLSGFDPDDGSPIFKEHVPVSNEPGKPIFRNLLIALGITLLLYIGVNNYKSSQARRLIELEQTQSVRATGTASFKATATESAKQSVLKEINNIKKSSREFSVYPGDKNFVLVEDNTDGNFECHLIESGIYKDFIIQAQITNPEDISAGWDYGIIFRIYDNNGMFRLRIDSSGNWALMDNTENKFKSIASGNTEVIRKASNSINTIDIFVQSDKGYLMINHSLVAELDLSARMSGGFVGICTDMLDSMGKTGNKIHVGNVRLWELP